jgi:hypothetical protein
MRKGLPEGDQSDPMRCDALSFPNVLACSATLLSRPQVAPTPMSESSPEEASGGASEPIHRGRGATASERILADLGDRAFLRLWSYPNLFIDKKRTTKGMGRNYAICLSFAETT